MKLKFTKDANNARALNKTLLKKRMDQRNYWSIRHRC